MFLRHYKYTHWSAGQPKYREGGEDRQAIAHMESTLSLLVLPRSRFHPPSPLHPSVYDAAQARRYFLLSVDR
jgi:hypothetical protein